MIVHVSRWLQAVVLLLPIPALAADPGDEIDFTPAFVEFADGEAEHAQAVAVQPDGRILLAGSLRVGEQFQVAIARMLPDGTPDPGFADGGRRRVGFGPGSQAGAGWIGVLPDGKILVLGSVYDNSTFSASLLVMRLLPNGEFDTSYSIDGRARYGEDIGAFCGQIVASATTAPGCDAQLLPDGSVLVAGGSSPPNARMKRIGFGGVLLYRLRPDATPDPAFGEDGHLSLRTLPSAPSDGPRLIGFRPGLAVRDDGRILVATGIETPAPNGVGIAVLQLRANGTPDTSFGSGGATGIVPDTGDNFLPFDVQVARDGAITVGAAAGLSGVPAFVVARFRSNGTRDSAFGSDGVAGASFEVGDEFATPGWASGLHIDSSGHIYVTGTTGTADLAGQENVDFALAAFTPQGAPDTRVGPGGRRLYGFDFSAGGGPMYVLREYALTLAVDGQGRLVVAGGGNDGSGLDAMVVRRILTRDLFRGSFEFTPGQPSG